jgi:hypothetical protein
MNVPNLPLNKHDLQANLLITITRGPPQNTDHIIHPTQKRKIATLHLLNYILAC